MTYFNAFIHDMDDIIMDILNIDILYKKPK